MAGRKRKLDEWDVLEIVKSEEVMVYDVVTELSPMHYYKSEERTPRVFQSRSEVRDGGIT